MWMQVAALLVSVVGTAAGANWLASGASRRLRDIKAHADLMSVTPPGEAHDLLARYVERQTLRHFLQLDVARVRRWSRAARFASGAAVGVAIVTVGVGLAALIAEGAREPALSFLPYSSLATGLLAGIGVVAMQRSNAALMELSEDPHSRLPASSEE